MQRRFVISGTVQARLRRFGGIQSDVLYPPPPKRDYRHDTYGDYLFGVSRLSPLKRFDLVLRALAEPMAASIKCVIAGEGAELDRLIKLRSHLELDHRVQFVGRLDEAGLDRPPRAVPCGDLPAVQRRLRLRHGRGLHVRQAGDHLSRQRRARPSW